MTESTIPSPKDARQMALARREAAQNERNAQLLEQRAVLYGEAQLKIDELMMNPDVDDVTVLKAINDVLDGKAPTAASDASSLSDEEQELLEVFRSGRIVRTDKGAFRDIEWGKRERQPRADVSVPTPEPAQPVSTLVDPPAPQVATPEPEPVVEAVSAPEPAPPVSDMQPDPAPTPQPVAELKAEPTPVVEPKPKPIIDRIKDGVNWLFTENSTSKIEPTPAVEPDPTPK